MLLDLATTLLKPLGFDVRTFRDPRKALAEYPAAKPVVVVTDYAMGDMNGMDLVRECKRLNPRQKTILMSGTVDEGVFANAQIKPDYFLAKPYQIRDFVEVHPDAREGLKRDRAGVWAGQRTGKIGSVNRFVL